MEASSKVIAAFLDLLQQDSYQHISINQITAKAGITRTYFYQLFDNKKDLAEEALFSIVQQLLAAFASSFRQADNTHLNWPSIVQGITLIRHQQTALAALLAVNSNMINLSARFQERLAKTVTDALSQRFKPSIQTDYGVHVFIAATMATIKWTIDHPDIPVPTIAKMVDNFTGNGMMATLSE
jgi:AcrR family transcriptional regulator